MATKLDALRAVSVAATALGMARILEDNVSAMQTCRDLTRNLALAQIAAIDAGASPAEVTAASEWEGR